MQDSLASSWYFIFNQLNIISFFLLIRSHGSECFVMRKSNISHEKFVGKSYKKVASSYKNPNEYIY